jgi:hypothetical protein
MMPSSSSDSNASSDSNDAQAIKKHREKICPLSLIGRLLPREPEPLSTWRLVQDPGYRIPVSGFRIQDS